MNTPYSVEKQLEFVKGYWRAEVAPRTAANALQLITLSCNDPHDLSPARLPFGASIPHQPEIDTLPHPSIPGEDFRPMALIRVGWLGLISLCRKPHPRSGQPWPTLCTFRYDDAERGSIPTEKPLSPNTDDHLPLSARSLDMDLLKRCCENFTETHSQKDTTLDPWRHASITMGHDLASNSMYPYITHHAPGMFTSVVLHPSAEPGLA